MVEQVTCLTFRDSVVIDRGTLSALDQQMGPKKAEETVCRAMEELALRLAQCERHFLAGKHRELHKAARSIGAIGTQIGLTSLSNVALQVTSAIESTDDVALAATLARAMRVGERSLCEIWDLQDLSG
jgi:hypothetical protein